jgi:nucleoredoxin
VVPFDAARLNGVKFYGIYFSASWCGPCKQFTPELVRDYRAIKAVHPEFEIIFVSWDRTEADLHAYLRDDAMPWPALKFADRNLPLLRKHAGRGIPCLVLIDASGNELSHSYRRGQYVGPDRVVEDTWKILKEARRKAGAQ